MSLAAHTPRRFGRASIVLAVLAAAAIALSAVGSASSGVADARGSEGILRTPPVLGVVGKDPNAKLVALDPRTLKRLASPKPFPIQRCISRPCDGEIIGPVLSPDGNQVAVVRPRGIDVVGRWRLRKLRTVRASGFAVGFWEMAWAGRAFLFTGEGKFGLALYWAGSRWADTDIQGYAIRTRDGWAVISPTISGSGLVVTAFTLHGEPAAGLAALDSPSVAAYDAHRNRLYVVSSNGEMAVVDMRTLDVVLPHREAPARGRPRPRIEFAWAGQGTLVLWPYRRASGLAYGRSTSGTGRRASSIATATDVRVSTNSIVTWNRERCNGNQGLRAWRGTLRFAAVPTSQGQEVLSRQGMRTSKHAGATPWICAAGRYPGHSRADPGLSSQTCSTCPSQTGT